MKVVVIDSLSQSDFRVGDGINVMGRRCKVTSVESGRLTVRGIRWYDRLMWWYRAQTITLSFWFWKLKWRKHLKGLKDFK
jgi:hypothetical protein